MDLATDLPAPSQRRVAVRITADAERQVRGGHPWVYESSVTSFSHEAAPGDLAVVFDRRREFCAIGLWDPTGPIRIRILHAGRPTPIDDDWWFGRLAAAVGRRGALFADETTNAFRLVHGENDGLPGLVVDLYGPHLVVKVDTPAVVAHLGPVLAALGSLVPAVTSAVLRTSRSVASHQLGRLADGADLVGSTPDEVEFVENGIRFVADLRRGQKTGQFLDQRENRRRLRDLAAGRSVLDVFCHTGGFGVHAAVGGARAVHFVDRSAPALEAAGAAIRRNGDLIGDCEVATTRGDAFEVLAAMARRGERYDVVVLDPPSFAHRRADVDGALAAHRRLTGAGLEVLAPGGLLVQASCSARIDAETFTGTVTAEAAARGRPLRSLTTTGHPRDHPVGFADGAYLAAVWATAP